MKKWLEGKMKHSFNEEKIKKSIFYDNLFYQESIEVERRVREIIKLSEG
jgi:hypothetical protein